MSLELIDTHCHLNLPDCFPDPESAIREATQAGVSSLILIAIDLDSSKRALEIASRHDSVYAVVGRHPNYAKDFQRSETNELYALCSDPKAVAIGEIGLDFHWDFATREQQERCLLAQLDLAADLGKPVVFHCRDAYPELLALLEGRPRLPYLFHCFSGDEADARRSIAMDATFGFDGPITYKKADSLRALAGKMPRDRIVIETDSPYLAPEPFRGKANKPAYLPYINRGLAGAMGISEDDCAVLTSANAKAFFRLP